MATAPRIYLDACALNRPTDPPSQPRVQLEASSVLHILRNAALGNVIWIASSVLVAELEECPSIERRAASLALLGIAAQIPRPSQAANERALQLVTLGYGPADALHLATAEENRCDTLLTTDDRFPRKALRGLGAPSVQVQNPVVYIKEVRL
ncbi:MAG: type II toxin-antitoxin system VapC family toxin [Terracidiphilus sp.]